MPPPRSLQDRDLRRRALDRSDARRDRGRASRIDAVDIYGLSEVIGPGRRQRVHRDQGRPAPLGGPFLSRRSWTRPPARRCPDGEPGELVLTTLTKEAMPVIRYRTRDLTRLLPGTARSMRRIGKVTGRSDDMLIIRGVNLFPTQIEELILRRRPPDPPLSARGPAPGPARCAQGDRRSQAGCGRPANPDRSRRRADPTHQVADRGHDRGRRGRAGRGRPLPWQSQADHRS